jgi:hypothetical protein
MLMKTVYVETSILSYLTARPTRDLLATARQQMTREWWDTRRARFDLFVSPLVEQEVKRGDRMPLDVASRPSATCKHSKSLRKPTSLQPHSSRRVPCRPLRKTMPRTLRWLRFTAWTTCSRGTAVILTTPRQSLSFVPSVLETATRVRRFAHQRN